MTREPFEYGACYEVRDDFVALRDRFVAGERMWYWSSAYSRYDSYFGFFFRQLGGGVRAWDVTTMDEAHAEADVRFRRVAPPSSLIEAAVAGDADSVRREVNEAAPAIETELALEHAATHGQTDVVTVLLRSDLIDDVTADALQRILVSATRGGHAGPVRALIGHGVDVNAADFNGATPLHFAATSGDVATVEALLDAGADPTHAANNGNTAVTLARAWRHETIVERLEQALRER